MHIVSGEINQDIHKTINIEAILNLDWKENGSSASDWMTKAIHARCRKLF